MSRWVSERCEVYVCTVCTVGIVCALTLLKDVSLGDSDV